MQRWTVCAFALVLVACSGSSDIGSDERSDSGTSSDAGSKKTDTTGTAAAPWTNTAMQTIVQNKCALTPCHGGRANPDFSNISEAEMKNLRDALIQVRNGTMPKNGSLTDAEKQTFEEFYK
jgi:hypothetical protein